MWRSYGPEFATWLNQAQRVDPENKQALLEVFFEPQWFVHLTQVNDAGPALACGKAANYARYGAETMRDAGII